MIVYCLCYFQCLQGYFECLQLFYKFFCELDRPWRCQLEICGMTFHVGFLLWLQVCCLCNLRGGALKPTTTGHWAHIVCAMSITEVSFQDIKLRSPIDVTNISPARLKLVSNCHWLSLLWSQLYQSSWVWIRWIFILMNYEWNNNSVYNARPF